MQPQTRIERKAKHENVKKKKIYRIYSLYALEPNQVTEMVIEKQKEKKN